MKRFLCVLVLVGACAVGLGFYLGWFHIGSRSTDGKSKVTFSVDTEKFQEDKKTAEEKIQHLGQRAKDKDGGPKEKSMDGVVVSVSGDKLTMTDKEGKELTQTLAANVKVTCDGKTGTAADLQPGMRIRVTTEKAEPHAITRIEALDANLDFEKGA
jgi:hypothetical protein